MPDPLKHLRHREIPITSRWTRRRRELPPAAPPPPPPPEYDLIVTGDPTPDCTGNYLEDGTHLGKPAYRRADSAWWIWHAGFESHAISFEPGNFDGPNYWFQPGAGPAGDYAPGPGHVGIAHVAPA